MSADPHRGRPLRPEHQQRGVQLMAHWAHLDARQGEAARQALAAATERASQAVHEQRAGRLRNRVLGWRPRRRARAEGAAGVPSDTS